MSNETAIEKNPLIADAALEKERIKAEADERLKQQQSIFGDNGAEAGPQSFSDGDDEEDDEDEKKPDDEKKSKKAVKK